MVVRPRRVILENRLVVLVCAVSGVILNWISWLSIKICKLSLSKTLNGLVLLSCCLWNL
jgi:predicted Na+-dependent transporter